MHNPHIIMQEGRQQEERGNYNVHSKVHYNGRYISGQHTHYNTEGNNKAGGIIMCTIPTLGSFKVPLFQPIIHSINMPIKSFFGPNLD